MAWGLFHGRSSPKPKTTAKVFLILSSTLQIKKDLKTVHCSNNSIKLSKPLQCSWCLNEDKRKNGLFYNCKSFYFHLKYCYSMINYPVNPTLDEAINKLQIISDLQTTEKYQ